MLKMIKYFYLSKTNKLIATDIVTYRANSSNVGDWVRSWIDLMQLKKQKTADSIDVYGAIFQTIAG